jgi:single-stranded-DNA-specific exonuclease
VSRRVERRDPGSGPALGSDLHPILEQVYRNRGVADAGHLDRSLGRLAPFTSLAGMREAVALLREARATGASILVVGDFDADGATATALGLLGLRAMGFAAVDYLVPNRFEYGYGLTPEIVAVARERDPGVLITVDNGISSISGVAAARDAGMQVVITDHHLPGAELPDAHAIVNPNQPGCAFPSKNLAGVGVMFYLLAALRAALREDGAFGATDNPGPNIASWLDLVALGTVADVVPLDQNNRILVEQGLRRIRAGRCRPGIDALLRQGRRDPRRCVASDLAFAAAPRLNAAGRLSDMSQGIECLLDDDPNRALATAEALDRLNRERREIESDMQQDAEADLESLIAAPEEMPFGLCLFQEHWHQGVVGIVASRVKERVHRPVIAFAREDDERLKGSARSIPGVHVRDVLDAVAAHHPDLLLKFGGHAMAAGLSILAADLDRFRDAFVGELRRLLDGQSLEDVLYSDGTLTPGDLDLELARCLRAGGPWGQAFPEPLFDGEFDVVSRRIVGDSHLKLSLKAPGAARPIDAIAFNRTDHDWPEGASRIHAAYRLDVNEWQNRETAQLVVEWLEVVGEGRR